jgi:hypothetical protein
MKHIEEKKEELTGLLSEQYSQNIIEVDEYERILEYINKIDTNKEFEVIKKIICENNTKYLAVCPQSELTINNEKKIEIPKNTEENVSVFSWRTNTLESINGNGGKYVAVFGTNQIIVNDLPQGRTFLNVESVFGLTEIIVPKNIKIINKIETVFSGVFCPTDLLQKTDEDLPELYITGSAVFGNITIITV